MRAGGRRIIALAAILLIALSSLAAAERSRRGKKQEQPAAAPVTPADKRDRTVNAPGSPFNGRAYWQAAAQCGGIYFKLGTLNSEAAIRAKVVKPDPAAYANLTREADQASKSATAFFVVAERVLTADRKLTRDEAVITYDPVASASGDLQDVPRRLSAGVQRHQHAEQLIAFGGDRLAPPLLRHAHCGAGSGGLSPRESRRNVMAVSLRFASLALITLAFAFPASAQDYPSRQVRVIVPFGAGGPADVYARVIAQHLSEQLKQTFVVEDRPGAGSIIGTDAVAKSPPDGYTLLVMSNTHTTNESLVSNKPFQLMRDFVPVATLNYSDLIMVVHPSVPAKDLKEFIALAKSKPGELNYASSGTGTPYHMAGELFKAMSGTNIVHVPHKASGEARNAVIGGHVQMMFDAITTMATNANAGQVRALGTTGTKRSELTPEVPTIAEAGIPGYEATIWLGVMAPAGTPKEVVEKLNREINKVIARPDVKEAWAKQGAVPMPMTPAEFDKYLREDIAKWANVVRVSGAKVN